MGIFVELSLILVAAALLAFICRLLRQPPVLGYIITGILLGPYVLNMGHSLEVLDVFSKIGVTILLFIVGLNLSPRVVQEVGKPSLLTGIAQVSLTAILGFLVMRVLGYPLMASVYTSLALTFSSTIIIVKLLSDKGDMHVLYGKIAIGVLLVQDIVASLILVFMSSGSSTFLLMGVKAVLAILAMYLLSKRIVERLGLYGAKSQELLFLFSIAWGMGFASLFYALGFSVEIGALIAGVLLSLTPYALEISSRLRPLRDFFIILFFITLGRSMTFSASGSMAVSVVALTLFVLVGNPLIMYVIMNVLRYTKRTSFFTAISFGQVSEFSFILITVASGLGYVTQEVVSLVTMVGVITIAGSTYLILYAHKLYPAIEPVLSLFSLSTGNNRVGSIPENKYDTVLFGYNRVGRDFVESFKKIERNYVVVDFNPDAVTRLKNETHPHLYGDAGDTEFLDELGFKRVSLAVSTIPDFETNLLLVQFIRTRNKKTNIIVLSHYAHEAEQLYEAGASYVIMPHHLGAQYAARMIVHYQNDPEIFEKEREKHEQFLQKRN
ncbi:MAG: cation:proton antiporter [Candidatus Roizmanbacteria bacterium]|nr:cation:proton antiporter [Candidatus Roizmanbacteria bacterium]